MITRCFQIVFLVVAALASSSLALGCGGVTRVYEPVAQHTLRAGPDSDTDVIWVQQYDGSHVSTLLRCQNGPSGPECRAVTPQ